ncbi:MAG: hypothetical protein U9Q06_03300 [Nanoarchaeota archaeon]|nr:hypothetical protein [Nanoarchaeota archaeon]
MKIKLIFAVLGILLFVNLVAATDVAYIVLQGHEIKQEFLDSISNVGLNHTVIYSNNLPSDFSEYKLILLNDESFTNWNEIPVNDVPALIVNGRTIKEWGWTKRVTKASSSNPIKVNVSEQCIHEICGEISGIFAVYDDSDPDIYYLDENDIYENLEIIASTTNDVGDGVIAVANAGTILTKPGKPDTVINANGVFFGIYQPEYWTDETRTLFENSLLWLAGDSPYQPGEFEFDIKEGYNLISFPLILDDNSVANLKNENPEIVSIKEYVSGSIVDAVILENNKGYFLESTTDSTLVIEGEEPEGIQSVSLADGINLVGITSLSDINLDSLPGEVMEVAKRNSDGSYTIATKYSSVWFNEFALIPGKGYWFKLNEEVMWNYTL